MSGVCTVYSTGVSQLFGSADSGTASVSDCDLASTAVGCSYYGLYATSVSPSGVDCVCSNANPAASLAASTECFACPTAFAGALCGVVFDSIYWYSTSTAPSQVIATTTTAALLQASTASSTTASTATATTTTTTTTTTTATTAATSTSTSSSNTSSSSSSTTGIIVGAVAIALVAVGLGLWYWYRKRNPKKVQDHELVGSNHAASSGKPPAGPVITRHDGPVPLIISRPVDGVYDYYISTQQDGKMDANWGYYLKHNIQAESEDAWVFLKFEDVAQGESEFDVSRASFASAKKFIVLVSRAFVEALAQQQRRDSWNDAVLVEWD
ncbi:hypothetical protein HK100_007711, partial [Physocladia obscura]